MSEESDGTEKLGQVVVLEQRRAEKNAVVTKKKQICKKVNEKKVN